MPGLAGLPALHLYFYIVPYNSSHNGKRRVDGKTRARNKSVCEPRVAVQLFRQLLRLCRRARMVLHQGASSLKERLVKSGAERRAADEGAAQAGSAIKNARRRQRMAKQTRLARTLGIAWRLRPVEWQGWAPRQKLMAGAVKIIKSRWWMAK